MRVPDGQDYLEMMLYKQLPDSDKRGTKNDVCLVPDVNKAVETLMEPDTIDGKPVRPSTAPPPQ